MAISAAAAVVLAAGVVGLAALADSGTSSPGPTAEQSHPSTTSATTTPGATPSQSSQPAETRKDRSETPTQTQSAPDATQPPLTVPAVAQAGGAGDLSGRAECVVPGQRPVGQLRWTAGQGRQRIALTPYADGFRSGRYDISPVLDAGVATYRWAGLNPGGVHLWIVQTRIGGSWAASPSSSLEAPVCPADNAG
jgi:hypothetical protein